MLMPHFQSWKNSHDIQSVSRILCAVSGGIDSMVMLDLFIKAELGVEVVHINYQLRGEDSDLDQQLVENICKKHKINFHGKRVLKPENCNTQEWARDTRYAFINELDRKHRYDFIATAHHQQDQLETALLSIFKGYNLQTIKPIRGKLVRPLLDVNRADLLSYASANDIEYRHDQSNFSNDYDRNFIRNEVIPSLRNRFENFDKRVLKFAERQTQKNKLADQLISERLSQFATTEFNNLKNYSYLKIDLKILEDTNGKNLLQSHLKKEYGFNKMQLEDLLLSNQNAITIQNKNFICKKDLNHLLIGALTSPMDTLMVIQKSQLPLSASSLKLIKGAISEFDSHSALKMDSEQVKFPLTLRKVRETDKFRAFGLKGKQTSLNKFLKDRGIDSLRRLHEYILVDDANHIIIPGMEIDYGLKLENHTKTCLFVDLEDKTS